MKPSNYWDYELGMKMSAKRTRCKICGRFTSDVEGDICAVCREKEEVEK